MDTASSLNDLSPTIGNSNIGAGVYAQQSTAKATSSQSLLAARWGLAPFLAGIIQRVVDLTGVKVIGGKVNRNIAGTTKKSLHAYGEAADLRGKTEQMYKASRLATSFPGVTEVIYNRQIWTPAKGWRSYTHPSGNTTNPTLAHVDHVHVGGKGLSRKTIGDWLIVPPFSGSIEAGPDGNSGTASGSRDPLADAQGMGSIGALDALNGFADKFTAVVGGVFTGGLYILWAVLVVFALYQVFRPDISGVAGAVVSMSPVGKAAKAAKAV